MPRLPASAALALLALAPPARATDFHDAAGDFAVDLGAPGAEICYVRPAALRDPAACSGVNLAALEKAMPGDRGVFAMVRFPDWAYWVMAGAEKRPGTGLLSRPDGRLLWESTVKKASSSSSYTPIGKEPEFLVVNDLQALRFRLTARNRSSPAAELLAYVAFGRNATVSLTFMTDANHLATMSGLAWKTASTLSMPPVRVAPTWDQAELESRAFREGEAIGRRLVYLVAIAVAGVVAVLVFRSVRRYLAEERARERSAEPQPKP